MRHHFYTVCLVLTATYSTSAQPAPDFSITDSEGTSHQLYVDYLNQGKTVVLKLFFTTCPPCNAIASATEQLNQEWGGGNNDVVFLSLSILGNDTDNLINNYKANHGITYPGAGPAEAVRAQPLPTKMEIMGFGWARRLLWSLLPTGRSIMTPGAPINLQT